MAAIGDLKLKVSPSAYQARIGTLEGYVSLLQNQVDEYGNKRNAVDNIWTATEADTYKNAIDQNIEKVNAAIRAAQDNIDQMNKLLQNMTETNIGVQESVDEALKIVQNLFS